MNTTDWTGCGGCDPAFRCWGGETRCMRLPLTKQIALPTKIQAMKHIWYPYLVKYISEEGPFETHIYAINDYHAELQLLALKATGKVVGKFVALK